MTNKALCDLTSPQLTPERATCLTAGLLWIFSLQLASPLPFLLPWLTFLYLSGLRSVQASSRNSFCICHCNLSFCIVAICLLSFLTNKISSSQTCKNVRNTAWGSRNLHADKQPRWWWGRWSRYQISRNSEPDWALTTRKAVCIHIFSLNPHNFVG